MRLDRSWLIGVRRGYGDWERGEAFLSGAKEGVDEDVSE